MKFRNPMHGRDHTWLGADAIGSKWIDVETVDDPDSPGDPTYQFQNSWDNVGDPYEKLQYRKGASGLEFQGHISGGASGSVVCLILPDHLPFKNVSFLTDVGDIGSFTVGRVEIDATTGEMTVTFPAT